MKKSQLRHIIRGVIKEQQTLKKIKKKPIKPVGMPMVNSHQTLRFTLCQCNGSQSWCQNASNYGIANLNIGITTGQTLQCNGQMCQPSDEGEKFYFGANYDFVGVLVGRVNPVLSSNLASVTSQNAVCPQCQQCGGPHNQGIPWSWETPGCCDTTTITTNGDYGTGPQTISAYSNYDPNATCYNSQNQCQTIITGCTDPSAQNYNPSINNTGNVGPNLINGTTQTLSDNSTCIY